MGIRAYNEIYLSHAMENLAVMMDCGINHYGIPPTLFVNRFITSGIAEQFEKGNPKYIAGYSGFELAEMVVEQSGNSSMLKDENHFTYGRSQEYWAGWVLAYYQWKSCRSFAEMQKYGIDISKVIAFYHPLHEADPEKFYDIAEAIITEEAKKHNPLKNAREQLGMTQRELSEASGISLRMIRAYEQKQQDISKAEYRTVATLARVLKVPVSSLA